MFLNSREKGAHPLFQALVHVINFYLDDANKEHRERIISAALGDEHVSNAEMEGYVREAIRQDPVTVGVLRECPVYLIIFWILTIFQVMHLLPPHTPRPTAPPLKPASASLSASKRRWPTYVTILC